MNHGRVLTKVCQMGSLRRFVHGLGQGGEEFVVGNLFQIIRELVILAIAVVGVEVDLANLDPGREVGVHGHDGMDGRLWLQIVDALAGWGIVGRFIRRFCRAWDWLSSWHFSRQTTKTSKIALQAFVGRCL